MDETPPHSPVPVGERVNRLELGVGDGGLDDGRKIFPTYERGEILALVAEAPALAARMLDAAGLQFSWRCVADDPASESPAPPRC